MKSSLTANSKFTYQGKVFLPGDKIPVINREDALELLAVGFVVGVIPKETPATNSKNTPKKGEKK